MKRIRLMQRAKYTTKALALELGISPMTIYNWRKRQTDDPLPTQSIPTKGGRHKNYVLKHEVWGWLERNRSALCYRSLEHPQWFSSKM